MQPSKIPLQKIFSRKQNNKKHSNRKGKMKKEERKQTKQILTVNSHHRKSWMACKRCGLKLIRMRSVSISIVYFAHTIPLQPRLSCCLLDTRLSVTIAWESTGTWNPNVFCVLLMLRFLYFWRIITAQHSMQVFVGLLLLFFFVFASVHTSMIIIPLAFSYIFHVLSLSPFFSPFPFCPALHFISDVCLPRCSCL